MLERCCLCPRACQADRLQGQRGYCGVADEIRVAHWGPHHGEEPPISGKKGSGNIFFASCNLRCVYCQNFQISHEGMGEGVTVNGLVEIFFALEDMGLHNVNLVSPTPYIPFIAQAIERSRKMGLKMPFVYNSHGYEATDTLRMLEGLIDIYLPDFKYWSGDVAHHLSGAKDYPERARSAILEMKRQVGDLAVQEGIARKGILVRHLVLPSNLGGSRHVLKWIQQEMGPETYVSLMAQYTPLHKASDYPMLSRGIREDEYECLLDFARLEGLKNVFIQELGSAHLYVPDFELEEPFQEYTKEDG